MKVHKPIYLSVPEKLANDLNGHLVKNPPDFKYRIEYFYYIIQYIQEVQLKNKHKNGYEDIIFVPLNIKKFSSITVSNIDRYIRILENGEFINGDNYFKKGEKSRGYKINPKYLGAATKIELKPGDPLFGKLKEGIKKRKAHYDRMEPHLRVMSKKFDNKLELDYDAAEKWILSQADEKKKYAYHVALSQLQDKRFRYFHRNKTNKRLDA